MDLPEVVPLFPLPDHVLLLGLPHDYRMFELRYRTLVDDLLQRPPGERWLAVPRLAEGWQQDYHGAPPFLPCAALAQARHIRPLAGGEWAVAVEGVARCRLIERASDRPYRLARPEPIADLPAAPTAIARGVAGLLALVRELAEGLGPRGQTVIALAAGTADAAALVDRLGSALLGDLAVRQRFLEMRRLTERIALLSEGLRRVLASARPGRGRRDPSTN